MMRFAILLLLPMVALAGGNHNNSESTSSSIAKAGASSHIGNVGSNVTVTGGNLTGGDLTGGDQVIGGDKAYALAIANSLGDVDIAECLGSTQWSSPVFGKQKLVLNQVCMAEFYLKVGAYNLAAMALCNVPEILAEFEAEADCENAHDFTPVYVESEPENDRFEALLARIDAQDALIASQSEEIQKYVAEAAKNRRAAQRRREAEKAEALEFINRYEALDDDED